MNQKLSQLAAPAIAGVVRERSVQGAIAEIKNCKCGGADMIDLHLSCLENSDAESLKNIISSTGLPVLALNYNITHDGRSASFTEEERVASLLRAVEAGADGIDMQGYTFDPSSKNGFCGEDIYSFTKGDPKEIVTDEKIVSKQCELIEKVHFMGAEVLLSCHPGVAMTSEQVVDLANFLAKRSPDIIKIVTVADTADELAESIRTMLLLKKEINIPVSYHSGGKMGTLSRIINPILGGQIIFCVDRYKEGSTMGQLDLRTARSVIDGIRKIAED